MKGGDDRGTQVVRAVTLPRARPDTITLMLDGWARDAALAVERYYPGGLRAWCEYHVAQALAVACRFYGGTQ